MENIRSGSPPKTESVVPRNSLRSWWQRQREVLQVRTHLNKNQGSTILKKDVIAIIFTDIAIVKWFAMLDGMIIFTLINVFIEKHPATLSAGQAVDDGLKNIEMWFLSVSKQRCSIKSVESINQSVLFV